MNHTVAVVVLLVAGYGSLSFLERAFPLRRQRTSLLPRLAVNAVVSSVSFLTAALLVNPASSAALGWVASSSFGLVHLLKLSGWSELIVSFLLLDLTFYYWHVANHRVPLLWRFHNVHHIDPDLDVSTAFRFHFAEVALSALFRVMQVAVIGPSYVAYVAYQLVFLVETQFHHSNVRLPVRVERVINYFIVTPRMHGIHHSQVQGQTNSNFSVVFSWWDRIHNTICLAIPQSEIVVGVPAYSCQADNRIWRCLVMPFERQRRYWRV